MTSKCVALHVLMGVSFAAAAMFWPSLLTGAPPSNLVFCCRTENDLYRILTADGGTYTRYDNPGEAVKSAAESAGVLILADGYPEKTTVVDPAVFEEAARKKLRLYVEYPAALPDVQVGPPKQADQQRGAITSELLRGVVSSEIFGNVLRPMRIVTINSFRYVPVMAAKSHLVFAKVAGVDTAVFGLKDTPTEAMLFDHPRGNLLVATTKLSHFVTGRYMPEEAWRTIWRTILNRLQSGAAIPVLAWTPTVRPTYGRQEPLPPDVELQALRRSTEWIVASRILRHPQWPMSALASEPRLRDMPAADWPMGDGSLGALEGFGSTIRYNGSQPTRYLVRPDCTCEIAMLMAIGATVNSKPQYNKIAANLLDYVLEKSGVSVTDSHRDAYGLIGWVSETNESNVYWGDDNARALLGVLAASATMKDSHWDDATVRCILGNFRTTGIHGYRQPVIVNQELQKRGWKSYWADDRQGRYTWTDDKQGPVMHSPHFASWLWACFLWAHDKTGFEPFLTRTEMGMRMLMAAYPDKWEWCNRSGSIERARALLPLAWLVRVHDTPEHRGWLRKVAEDLIALQDSSGAIRETIGGGGHSMLSNAEYGTGETSLIQTDGDPVCDMLYTCNFALIGLHEAAAATGDAFYAEAEEKLAKFLCRIQIRSEVHPELDGAWYRAFNLGNWGYWASNADWEWGPWCVESGWTQPWIAGTLALRQMKTSLWDLTKQSRIKDRFAPIRKEMLPDEVLLPMEVRK